MPIGRLSLELNLPSAGTANSSAATPATAVSAPPEVRFLTLSEAAACLRTSVRTVQRKVKAQLIRTASLGPGAVRIPWSEILRLEAGLPIAPVPTAAPNNTPTVASAPPQSSSLIQR